MQINKAGTKHVQTLRNTSSSSTLKCLWRSINPVLEGPEVQFQLVSAANLYRKHENSWEEYTVMRKQQAPPMNANAE